MHKLTHKLKELGGRRIAFSLVVLAYLGFLGLISVSMILPGNQISDMGHFSFIGNGDTHDLIHELMFAFIVGTGAAGLFSQLWKPKENFAGLLVALTAWIAMVLTAVITNNWVPQPLFIIFGGLTILATILHPAGRGLFNWFGGARANGALLSLVGIAAIPLLALAFTNIKLQTSDGRSAGFFGHNPPSFHGGSVTKQELLPADAVDATVNDETDHDQKHIALGHYRNFAVFSFIIIVVGVLASFRPQGWRLAAWIAGILPFLFGLISMILPDAESSLSTLWSFAALGWGVVFIAAAEFTRRKASQ